MEISSNENTKSGGGGEGRVSSYWTDMEISSEENNEGGAGGGVTSFWTDKEISSIKILRVVRGRSYVGGLTWRYPAMEILRVVVEVVSSCCSNMGDLSCWTYIEISSNENTESVGGMGLKLLD